jgi:MarR family transcriptional regulator for hemolysin
MEEEALGLIFKRIFHAVKKDADNRMKEWDLTMSQAMVLEYLSNPPPENPTQKDIEHHFGLQHPTVSGILKRLEKHGFIRTEISEADRRAKNIYLTERALLVDRRAKSHQAQMEETFVRGFTPREVETLRSYLERVLANVTEE